MESEDKQVYKKGKATHASAFFKNINSLILFPCLAALFFYTSADHHQRHSDV